MESMAVPLGSPAFFRRLPKPVRLTLVAWLVVFTAFSAFELLIDWPSRVRDESVLAAELRAVMPPPGAELVEFRSYSKPREATAIASYRDSIDYETLVTHYTRELGLRGWRPLNEVPLTGERVKCFGKSEFRAELSYAEGRPDGWDFALQLISGPVSICQ